MIIFQKPTTQAFAAEFVPREEWGIEFWRTLFMIKVVCNDRKV
jgi:hypothetical protein